MFEFFLQRSRGGPNPTGKEPPLKSTDIVWKKALASGSLLKVSARDNREYFHALHKTKGASERFSLIFRVITTFIPIDAATAAAVNSERYRFVSKAQIEAGQVRPGKAELENAAVVDAEAAAARAAAAGAPLAETTRKEHNHKAAAAASAAAPVAADPDPAPAAVATPVVDTPQVAAAAVSTAAAAPAAIHPSVALLREKLKDIKGQPALMAHLEKMVKADAMQQARAERGIVIELPNRNMVFNGPPGTGKTVMALRLGEALSQIGVLKKSTVVLVDKDHPLPPGDTAGERVSNAF